MADKLKMKAGFKVTPETILYEGYQKEDEQMLE